MTWSAADPSPIADNQTYSGLTVAKLRRIDPKVSGTLSIVRATSAKYGVELTGSSVTWSYTGPGGAPTFGRCSRG